MRSGANSKYTSGEDGAGVSACGRTDERDGRETIKKGRAKLRGGRTGTKSGMKNEG